MSEATDLPDGWHWTTLGDILEDGRKIAYGVLQPGSDFASGIPLVRVCDVADGKISIESLKRIDPQIAAKFPRTKLQGGEILLTIVGTIGRTAIVPESLAGANTARAVAVIPTNNLVDARFVELSLRRSSSRDELTRASHEVARKTLNLEDVRVARIPIAPLPEQRRIVSKIEELFSDLDAGVSALERAKANLKRYRASVLKAAVEGRLTADWRAANPNIEPASELLNRILTARRQTWEANQIAEYERKGKEPPAGWKGNYIEPVSPQDTPEARLPNGWCWATVDQLATVGTGTTPKRSERRFYDGGTIPWVTSTAVNEPNVYSGNDLVTEIAISETTLKVYPKHTLIVALYGEGKTRGKVSELQIEATINQALGSLVLDGEAHSVRPYLKLFLDASYISLRRKAAGGMQPNLNLSLLKETLVALPPTNEQEKIVERVESALSIEAAMSSLLTLDGVKAERLRQSILKHAFAGRLVPQNDADEPASELLARIASARNENTDSEQGNNRPNRKVKVSRMKKPQRRPLLDVLHDQKNPISPERLMNEAGFLSEEIDEFYAELRTIKAKIKEVRPSEEKQNRWPYDEKIAFLIEAK